MARPAKAIGSKTGKMTKQEIAERTEREESLKGGTDQLMPEEYLNERQRYIFFYLVDCLKQSGILGNIDVYVLNQAAVTIDRIQYFETVLNNDPELFLNSTFMASKDKYSKDFFRLCNELSLSPQARAKLSIAQINESKSKNPILEVLDDDD